MTYKDQRKRTNTNLGRNTNLHNLHPWGRGGRLQACKSRRRGAARTGRKLQEPRPLPRQRKSVASSAISSGACSVFKHGSKGEAKARKNHAAAFLFPQKQIASGSGSLEGCRMWDASALRTCQYSMQMTQKKMPVLWPQASRSTKGGARPRGPRRGQTCLPPEPAWNRKLQQRRQENSSSPSLLCSWGLWRMKPGYEKQWRCVC